MRMFVRSIVLGLLLAVLPTSAHARVKLLCTIGDSLVAGGPILAGNPGWTSLLQTRRAGELFGAINGGVGGTTVAQALALFESDYRGHGCTHMVILAGTNPLASGDSAASLLVTLEALIASARADTSGSPDGIDVTILTVPPRGGSTPWDGTKETQRLVLRTSILALTSALPIDLESMGCTGTPIEMCAAYRYSDLLHFNGTPVTGGSQKVFALIDAAVPW